MCIIKTFSCRSSNKVIQKKPMKHSTPNENPSQKTLNFIKQLAYTYRVVNIKGRNETFCLN